MNVLTFKHLKFTFKINNTRQIHHHHHHHHHHHNILNVNYKCSSFSTKLRPRNYEFYIFHKDFRKKIQINKIKKVFKKSIIALTIFSGLYIIYRYFLSKNGGFRKSFFLDPIDDILNSKEVKGTGILLLEDLFKDKRTKQNVLVALKSVIKEKQFEDEFKIFIKAWLFKVIKHPDFLKETKHTVIEVFKSPQVSSEIAVLLKFISNQETTKQFVSTWMKEIFLGPSVFEDFCFLFEKCAINSVKNEKTKSEVNVMCTNLIKDREFMSLIYMKALNILENSNNVLNNNKINEAV
jgi:hypothetical protein